MKKFFLTLFGGEDKSVQVVDLLQFFCLGFFIWRCFQWAQLNWEFLKDPLLSFIPEGIFFVIVIFGKVTLLPVVKGIASLLGGRFKKPETKE